MYNCISLSVYLYLKGTHNGAEKLDYKVSLPGLSHCWYSALFIKKSVLIIMNDHM